MLFSDELFPLLKNAYAINATIDIIITTTITVNIINFFSLLLLIFSPLCYVFNITITLLNYDFILWCLIVKSFDYNLN